MKGRTWLYLYLQALYVYYLWVSSSTILYHINSHDVSGLCQKRVCSGVLYHRHYMLYKSYWGVTTIKLTCIQAPLSDQLGSPLTEYLLEYCVYDVTTTVELPALNTSHTPDSVPCGAFYNITVSCSLSEVGSTKNNPSVWYTNLLCKFFYFFSFFGREPFPQKVKHLFTWI